MDQQSHTHLVGPISLNTLKSKSWKCTIHEFDRNQAFNACNHYCIFVNYLIDCINRKSSLIYVAGSAVMQDIELDVFKKSTQPQSRHAQITMAVVIPKKLRKTMKLKEGDTSPITVFLPITQSSSIAVKFPTTILS